MVLSSEGDRELKATVGCALENDHDLAPTLVSERYLVWVAVPRKEGKSGLVADMARAFTGRKNIRAITIAWRGCDLLSVHHDMKDRYWDGHSRVERQTQDGKTL